jgi:hypothetical protein
MTTLTVGAGEEYATLASAIAASANGDVIDVLPGVYTNDFATIRTNITIQGMGGVAQLVATIPPPNGKAILTTDADVTIANVSFSGAAVADNNGAGIRDETGNLTLVSDSFIGNQEGILANPGAAWNLTILSSEFGFNGAGDGLSHNLYAGALGTLDIADSYFHDAVGGNEIKSRALTTTITGTRIIDGPVQTGGGYDVDLPDGGNATLTDDVIEKGLNEPNGIMVHFGGEAVPYAGSTLDLSDSLLVNDDLGPQGRAIYNDQGYGPGAVATAAADTIYNVIPAYVVEGPGSAVADTLLAGSVSLDAVSPVLVPAIIDVVVPAGPLVFAAGTAVNPFAGLGLSIVNDAATTLTMNAYHPDALGYAGGDPALKVATGPNGITVAGAASAIVAGLLEGEFTYDAEASGSDEIVATLVDPAMFLVSNPGDAAAAASSFSETVAVAACYRAGTRIAAPGGERPVESFAAGDLVTTASGAARRVRWAARRAYAGAMVARHPHLQPIRFRAGALGGGLPRRDLYVSPRHAMFIDGMLVPAEALVDGDGIARCREPIDTHYHHLELDTHDILLAEGAPSESYCDCDNRGVFHNAADAEAQRDGAERWKLCAPHVQGGPRLQAVRAWLAGGPALSADGETIFAASADGRSSVYVLGSMPRRLALISASGVPAELGLSPDVRRLGVAVHRISLAASGAVVVMEHSCALLREGFHAAEPSWRWTDGEAAIPMEALRGLEGVVTVVVEATSVPWRRARTSPAAAGFCPPWPVAIPAEAA